MNSACAICRGACCETVMVKVGDMEGDLATWLGYHGTVYGGWVEMGCRCEHLGGHGKCRIWEKRPKVCAGYLVGGWQCRDAIGRRRYGKLKKRILEELA